MRIIGAKEQQTIDRVWTKQTGLPLLLLMEHAARAVLDLAEQMRRRYRLKHCLVLCGPGQNGGDGYACARLLKASGWSVTVREILPQVKRSPQAQANRKALVSLGFTLAEPAEQDFTALHNSLIIDGLFGTGFSLERPNIEILENISVWLENSREANNKVLAIDVPSGVVADSGEAYKFAVRADWTVTFIFPKVGLCTGRGRILAGRWSVASLGIDPVWADHVLEDFLRTTLVDSDLVSSWQPNRQPDAHKGLLGRVLILAGSEDMPGAAALAAEAAGRSGAGLIHLAAPSLILPSLVKACPEALIQSIDNSPQLDHWLDLSDAVLIGPGIAAPPYLAKLLDLAILKAKALVIDADALNSMAARREYYQALLKARCQSGALPPAILTPHPGEMKRLSPHLAVQKRLSTARQTAKEWHSFVVLKGYGTVMATPQQDGFISLTGHDGLSRGGSGDVLAGLIAGLLAQKMPEVQAMATAVWVHGKAGELAGAEKSRRTMLPGDVISCFSRAFQAAGWEENK